MTGLVLAVVALAVINMVYKGVGPAVLGDRTFPRESKRSSTRCPQRCSPGSWS